MRRRTFAALGAGASVSAATCALLTTGVVGASLAVLVAPPAPAAAEELQPFERCEELRQWYVDAALPLVGPWGLGWPGVYAEGGAVLTVARDVRAAAPSPAEAVGSGDTGTNVQEAGVDEPDVAKTDGAVVVHLDRGDLVVSDVRGEPREVSRTELPGRLTGQELLLVENTVVVLGQDGFFHGGPVVRDIMPSYGGVATTHMITFDITDPAAPRLERHDRIDGALVSAREYDGTVRAVISTGAPTLDFVHPTRRRSAREATRENRKILRDSTITDWLPQVHTGDDSTPLVACTDVRHPEEHSGTGTISVVTFAAETPGERSATAVTAGGHMVYSSTDRLYIATAAGGWGQPIPLAGRGAGRRPAPPTTQVHAFAIDGPSTAYVASGDVPGTVQDRWSFSEHDGRLRVATALGDSWNPRENAVVVLEERDDDLVEVGRVDEIGVNEQIQSVRWFGDLAIVVTFRQVDPLYTVDLSDPAAPRVMGELKIPGFSSYLHPVGNGRLLGLGQDATLRGSTRGAQASLFDVSDLADPRRSGTAGFDRHTEFTTAWDSRAFTFLPERGIALAPVQDYRSGRTRIAVLQVHADGRLTRTLTEQVAGWRSGFVRTLPLGDGRVALVVGGDVGLLSV